MLFLLAMETETENEAPVLLPCEGWEPMDPDQDYATVEDGAVWVDGATETGTGWEDSAADATAYLHGRTEETPDEIAGWIGR